MQNPITKSKKKRKWVVEKQAPNSPHNVCLFSCNFHPRPCFSKKGPVNKVYCRLLTINNVVKHILLLMFFKLCRKHAFLSLFICYLFICDLELENSELRWGCTFFAGAKQESKWLSTWHNSWGSFYVLNLHFKWCKIIFLQL